MIFPTKTWTGRQVKLSLSRECEKFLCKLFGKWSLVYLPRVVISFHCIFIKPSSQRPVKLQPRKPTSIPKKLENDGIHVKFPFQVPHGASHFFEVAGLLHLEVVPARHLENASGCFTAQVSNAQNPY